MIYSKDLVQGFIIGRAAIAFRLGRSEKTISRWVKSGVLPATHDGPFGNNLLVVREADIEKLKSGVVAEA